MKNTEWELVVKNPITSDVISTETYRTLKDIAKKYSNISLTTLRNIGMGRSKVYNKFITLNKINIIDINKNEYIQTNDLAITN